MLFCAAPARAELRAEIELRVGESGSFGAGPAEARLGEEIVARAVLRDGRRRLLLPAGAELSWFRLVPRPLHRDHPRQGRFGQVYANSVMGGPEHGRWLGYDRLEYDRRFFPSEEDRFARVDGPLLRLRGVDRLASQELRRPPHRAPEAEAAGSLWLQVEIRLPDGRRVRSPGREPAEISGERGRERAGLARGVARLSFRTGDDFLGWMSTYFGVPYVFGSTPAQSERYLGIDCADVMIAARRRIVRRPPAYTFVVGLARHAEPITETLRLSASHEIVDAEGRAVTLRWGAQIRAGDLVAFDYAGEGGSLLPRAWDHVGSLHSDSGASGRVGVLDGMDLVRHMGLTGLTDEPLRGQGRGVHLRILRWRR